MPNKLEDFKNDDGTDVQMDVIAFLNCMNQHGLKVFMAIAGEGLNDGKGMMFVGHFSKETLADIVGQIHHMVVKKGKKLETAFTNVDSDGELV
jgi:hypothetical protein